MQVTTGERGDLRVTRKRLAPLCSAVDVQHRTTGRPATGETSETGDQATKRSSNDEAGHGLSPVGDGGRGLGP